MAIGSAFRAFFSLLGGKFPDSIARAHGYTKVSAAAAGRAAVASKPQPGPKDGALQLLGILQRDARLVDFLMEDISGYADEQVGAAVRNIHQQSRETLDRYVKLKPVLDGVEGEFMKTPASESADAFKFIGNVPANGKVSGGLLRHKGWKASQVDLPALSGNASVHIVAPAELEIE